MNAQTPIVQGHHDELLGLVQQLRTAEAATARLRDTLGWALEKHYFDLRRRGSIEVVTPALYSMEAAISALEMGSDADSIARHLKSHLQRCKRSDAH